MALTPRSRNVRRFIQVMTLLLVPVLMAACGDSPTSTPGSSATSAAQVTGTSASGTSTTAQGTSGPTGNATSAAQGTLRLGYFPNLTHIQALVGIGDGSFAASLGNGVKLTTTPFNAGPAAIEALLAGSIDMTYIGPSPTINAFVKTQGAGVTVIAGAASGGVSFVVRSDETINSPQDLAGKKIATPQLGNTQDVALRAYLVKNGLNTVDKGGTVTVVPTDNPNILQLFANKQIDGAWVPEPWAGQLVTQYKGRVFVDERDLWPNKQFIITQLVVSTKFLKEHPDLVKAFLAAHVDVTQKILQDPTAAKKTINAQLKTLTGKALDDSLLDTSFSKISVLNDPLKSTALKSADDAFALGFLGKTKPVLDGLYDLTLLNQVLKDKGLPPVS